MGVADLVRRLPLLADSGNVDGGAEIASLMVASPASAARVPSSSTRVGIVRLIICLVRLTTSVR